MEKIESLPFLRLQAQVRKTGQDVEFLSLSSKKTTIIQLGHAKLAKSNKSVNAIVIP